MNWDEDIEGYEYVPRAVEEEMDDIWQRVRTVTDAPLSYVGAGMTAVVLRAGTLAYKVGRARHPSVYSTLEAEGELLESAHALDPEHVVRPIEFLSDPVVLVKEYVEGRPFGWATTEVQNQYQRLANLLHDVDWGPPEYKDDAYVKTDTGFVLVDGGFASRLCDRLADWIGDVLDGRRHPWSFGRFDHEFVAFLLRREVAFGCVDPERGRELERRLTGIHPNARTAEDALDRKLRFLELARERPEPEADQEEDTERARCGCAEDEACDVCRSTGKKWR